MSHHPPHRLRAFSATDASSSFDHSRPADERNDCGEKGDHFGKAHRRRIVPSQLPRRQSSAFVSSHPACIFGTSSAWFCWLFLSRRRLLLGCALLLFVLLLLRLFSTSAAPFFFDGRLSRFLCSFDDRHRFTLFKRFLLLKCSNNGAAAGLRLMDSRRHLLHHELVVEPWHGATDEGVVIRPPSDSVDMESCTEEVRQWREREAVAALQVAKRSRWEGNMRKGRSIIEHAYSLAPYNPDILTEYGIYVEMARSDVVQAEGFYLKALARNPKHQEALIRRQKALPLVEQIDNRMMHEIHRKRDHFMRIPHNDSGLRRSMRESYFAYVYHTVAMEGNTINLAQTRSILETKMAVAGKSIVEHNEILGLDAALRYLNQSLLDVREITLEHILALHKRVLGFADPLAAGAIRQIQVFVGNFRPPDPEFVMTEMEELVTWLNDEETTRLDAVEVAALAHYKLVFIHPFIDGNGRTARLLMNWVLLRAGFPPVIIPVEQRHRYYHVLGEANDGDLRPFIRFIAELTDRTLESLIASATASSSVCEIGDVCPSASTASAAAASAVDSDGGKEVLDANHSNENNDAQQQQQFGQPFCAAMEAQQHGIGIDGR